jgi:hypothetical protein
MGSGIAEICARSGLDVIIREVDDAAVAAGRARVERSLKRGEDSGKVTAGELDTTLGRLHYTTGLADLADRDLTIQAATENPQLKTALFAELDAVVKRPDAILATNTSSIPIAEIRAVHQPRRAGRRLAVLQPRSGAEARRGNPVPSHVPQHGRPGARVRHRNARQDRYHRTRPVGIRGQRRPGSSRTGACCRGPSTSSCAWTPRFRSSLALLPRTPSSPVMTSRPARRSACCSEARIATRAPSTPRANSGSTAGLPGTCPSGPVSIGASASPVARLQIQAVISRVLDRMPDYELADAAGIEWTPGYPREPKRVDVRFTPRPLDWHRWGSK